MGPPGEHLIFLQLFSSSFSLVPPLLYSPRWADTLFYFQNPSCFFPHRRINLHSICTTKDFYFKTPDGADPRKSLTEPLRTSRSPSGTLWMTKEKANLRHKWALSLLQKCLPPFLWPHTGIVICCINLFLILQLGGQRLLLKLWQKSVSCMLLFPNMDWCLSYLCSVLHLSVSYIKHQSAVKFKTSASHVIIQNVIVRGQIDRWRPGGSKPKNKRCFRDTQ